MAREFGEDVFTLSKLREVLTPPLFSCFKRAVEEREQLDLEVAEAVALEVRKWAFSRGVTHYTHWFLPLTGLAAGKQNSFLEREAEGQFIEKFSARDLVKGEPDASSFPHGGMRSTFEARGYTFWDISSPLFIRRNNNSNVLYIPSLFFSYDGKVLDKKTPLLRSLKLISDEARNLLELFGHQTERVLNMIGPEQEFFLVREEDYRRRPDLFTLGRVLFAAPPPRGQQMGDHYFGSIPESVQLFLDELEEETFRLGIPIKTRHNEVAPNQFEVAPFFEEAVLAVDHNQLLMEILTSLARKHRLVCLLHEKPFSFFNGSGKHLNWSLQTAEGWNVFSAGQQKKQKLIFLGFLAAFLRGIYAHHDLLQAALASEGNELRLGGHEAPPAIISVFLGEQLERLLNNPQSFLEADLESTKNAFCDRFVPQAFLPDLSDRNRTSPVAFTGNKFEFRMPGASASLAFPLATINLAVADGIAELSSTLKKCRSEVSKIESIAQFIKSSSVIVFNGDNYSAQWQEEARKRKLFIPESFVTTVEQLNSEKNCRLFLRYKLLSTQEVEARTKIKLELYWKTVQMELEVARYLLRAFIIPAAVSNQKDLLFCLNGYQQNELKSDFCFNTERFLLKFGEKINRLMEKLTGLDLLNEELKELVTDRQKAQLCCQKIRPELALIQKDVSRVEERISRTLWPLPNMAEMLFRY